MNDVVKRDLENASNYSAQASTLCLQSSQFVSEKLLRDELKEISLQLTEISAALSRITILSTF